jgi:hypothetical protein
VPVGLSQTGEKTGLLHPVDFHSHNYSPAEINHEIHHKKEFLAIKQNTKNPCNNKARWKRSGFT